MPMRTLTAGQTESTSRSDRPRHDLGETTGYEVADCSGHIVGRVECAMYGTSPTVPDALAVRSGFLSRKRLLVAGDWVEHIDGATRVVELRIARDAIPSFL